jgi:hypothetical protein
VNVNALIAPTRRQLPFQPLQHQRLIRASGQIRIHEVGRQQRERKIRLT